MNSQQELLDAINTINGKKDKSFDTPATVLRVDGDTVWVHIDGGADETPVQKTINCEQGDTVQVRISDGSAFLVGNASAPPTDDTTANVAHFVAEQADEKATKAIRSVEAIEQTVEGKVDSGDSGITNLSSTMYQNVNGVNIYNNTLAVGDNYAHIDGDSFDIREASSAGVIDDTNDTLIASFGREVTVGTRASGLSGFYSQVFGHDCIASGNYSHAEGINSVASGYVSHVEGGDSTASGRFSHAEGTLNTASGDFSHAEGTLNTATEEASHAEGRGTTASGYYSHAEGYHTIANGNYSHTQNLETVADSSFQTVIGKYNVSDSSEKYAFIIGNGDGTETGVSPEVRSDAFRVDWNGNVLIDGEVKTLSGNRKYVAEPSSEGTSGQVLTTDGNGGRSWTTVGGGGGPTVLTSSTISSSTTSYTFTDNAILADSVIDVYDTIFGFAPTGMTVSAGSCTITFPAQSSSHTIKLFIY